jgi:CAAX protease family protein
MPWDFILLLALLGIVVPWHSAVQIRRLVRLPEISTAERLAVYGSTIAFQWLVALVALWRATARGFSLAALGLALPAPGRAAWLAAALSVALVAYQIVSLRRLARTPEERQGFSGLLIRRLFPQNRTETAAFVAVAATAAVCEEFLYRGFVLAALAGKSAARPLAGILGSALLFAVAHLYQGAAGVATTFVWGAGFAGAKVWTGSLVPTIVPHFLVDLTAGLLGPRLLARRPAAPPPAPSPRNS